MLTGSLIHQWYAVSLSHPAEAIHDLYLICVVFHINAYEPEGSMH